MISRLKLNSLLLHANLEIELHKGLNVFTGETGAGKSLLLEGVPFAFGMAKTRLSEGKAVVEIAHKGQKEKICREAQNGKSSYKINGKPAKATSVRRLGEENIIVLEQGAARALLEERKHLKLLDAYLEKKLLQEMEQAFALWKEKERAYNSLKKTKEKVEKERDFLEFQLQELRAQNLEPGIDEKLKRILDKLEHQEQVQEALQNAYTLLYSGDAAASERIAEARKNLERIRHFLPEIQKPLEQLEALSLQLDEIIEALSSHLQIEPFEEEKVEELRERYFAIQELKRKHRKSIEELIALQKELEEKLKFSMDDSALKHAEKEAQEAKEKAMAIAKKIRRARVKAAKELEQEIVQHLRDLMLKKAEFQVAITPAELDHHGMDQVRFLFRSSPSLPLKPLSRIVSGGELSRVYLSLLLCIAHRQKIPTLVIDEIEAGLGGEAAFLMGKKLGELSRKVQILLITHQPAIAAFADEHFFIDRSIDADGRVAITKLDQKGRLEELARMLRGASKTKPARALAEELLRTAKNEKLKKWGGALLLLFVAKAFLGRLTL